MADLVVSYLIKGLRGRPRGLRVFKDGQVESYLVSRTVKKAGREFADESVTPGWYSTVQLSDEQLAAVQRMVADSGLVNLTPNTYNPGTGSTSTNQAEWQVMTSDGIHNVKISPWPMPSDIGRNLQDIVNRLGMLVNLALSGSESIP